MTQAYEEIVEFLAGGTTPQSLIDFRPSETTKAKVADLIHRQKTATLSADQNAELNCLSTALQNRATLALTNGPPSSQHFFATNPLRR